MVTTVRIEETSHGESLEQVRDRFKRWREARVRGEHIPASLWDAAVGIARKLGLRCIADELGVDFDRLKRRVEQAGGALPANKVSAQFVELSLAPTIQSGIPSRCECVIEMENTRGAKMRVELNGTGLAGLASMCTAFWSGA